MVSEILKIHFTFNIHRTLVLPLFYPRCSFVVPSIVVQLFSDRSSFVIRLLSDHSSDNNRTTIEQQTDNRRRNTLVKCLLLGGNYRGRASLYCRFFCRCIHWQIVYFGLMEDLLRADKDTPPHYATRHLKEISVQTHWIQPKFDLNLGSKRIKFRFLIFRRGYVIHLKLVLLHRCTGGQQQKKTITTFIITHKGVKCQVQNAGNAMIPLFFFS